MQRVGRRRYDGGVDSGLLMVARTSLSDAGTGVDWCIRLRSVCKQRAHRAAQACRERKLESSGIAHCVSSTPAPGTNGTKRTGSSVCRIEPSASAGDHGQELLAAPKRHHQTPAFAELFQQRFGNVGCGGSHDDRVKGRGLSSTRGDRPRASSARCVMRSSCRLRRARVSSCGDALHGVYMARQPRQQSGLDIRSPCRSRAPIQPLPGARQLQHPRHHPRLRNGLPESDRQRGVLVRAMRQRFVDEDVALNLCEDTAARARL